MINLQSVIQYNHNENRTYFIINNLLNINMSKGIQTHKSSFTFTVSQNTYYHPYANRQHNNLNLSTQAYIKQWIHQIFYNEQKIDAASQCTIYRRLIKEKSYQLSSCSMIYSIIREQVKDITSRLRKCIDFSHQCMIKQHGNYCNIVENNQTWNSSWKQLKNQQDPEYLKLIYPITSKIYIFAYVYMCEISKEIVKLWKILSDCTHIKDIKINTIETKLKELINELFTQPTDIFKPKLMLPIISKAYNIKHNNCKSSQKYEEISFLENSDLIINMKGSSPAIVQQKKPAEKKTLKDINDKFSKKLQKNFYKNRMDYKHLQQIKKFYLENDDLLMDKVEAKRQNGPNKTSQIKNELIKSFDFKKESIFELEDNSSLEEDQEFVFVDNYQCDKENLIEEHDQIQIQNQHLDQQLFRDNNRSTQESSKLSSSSGTQEVSEHFEATMKNYEKEPIPPELVYSQQLQDEKDFVNKNIKLIAKQCNNLFETQLNNDFNQNQRFINEKEFNQGVYEKMTRLKLKICRSKQNMLNQKKIQQLDKKKLEEEKQKLQKYRKQLEKEKQELLRQVQKFMKQKKTQEFYLPNMKDSHHGKIRREDNRYIHFNKYNSTMKVQRSIIKLQSIRYQEEIQNYQNIIKKTKMELEFDQKIDELITDSQKLKQIQEAIQKDILIQQENKKLSKKQQKLKKRKQREASSKNSELYNAINSQQRQSQYQNLGKINLKQFLQRLQHQKPAMVRKESKPEQKHPEYNEKEIALNTLLQNIQLNDQEKINCNIQESQIQRWCKKMQDLQNNIPLKAEESKINYSLLKNEPILAKKKKKKNKNE